VTRQMCAAGRMDVSMGVVAHLGAGQMDSVVVQLSTSARCVRTIDCVVMLIDVTRQMCAAGRMGQPFEGFGRASSGCWCRCVAWWNDAM